MDVRIWSLTEGNGKERLSSFPSSVCRSSWRWFCEVCAVGCLNIAGVIDSWIGGGLQLQVDLPSTEPPSRLENLTFETRLNFSRMSCLFLTVLWWTCPRKDLNMVAELDCPKRAVVTVRPGRDQPLLWWWKCMHARTHTASMQTCNPLLASRFSEADRRHRLVPTPRRRGFRNGRNHTNGLFKLTPLTMLVCRQDCKSLWDLELS